MAKPTRTETVSEAADRLLKTLESGEEWPEIPSLEPITEPVNDLDPLKTDLHFERECYDEGKEAEKRGLEKYECPYDLKSPAGLAWLEGWTDGGHEYATTDNEPLNPMPDEHLGEAADDLVSEVIAGKPHDPFIAAYLICALWSSNDESDESGGDPLDQNYSITDFAPEALQVAYRDCSKFQKDNAELLHQAYELGLGVPTAGHDFWLDRNGHGSGYWDEDLIKGELGDKLSAACDAFGNQDAVVGDDGKIYLEGGRSGADHEELALVGEAADKLVKKLLAEKGKPREVATIGDLENGGDDAPEYTLVQNEQDIEAVREYLGTAPIQTRTAGAVTADHYGGFFVVVGDGDYDEIWGFHGSIPYLSKPVYRLK